MTYVVLRPYWNIPPSILRGEIIPAIQRDRGYIARKNFEVTTHDGKTVTSGGQAYGKTEARTDKLARPCKTHLSEREQRVSPQHSFSELVLAIPPRLQSRMQIGRAHV